MSVIKHDPEKTYSSPNRLKIIHAEHDRQKPLSNTRVQTYKDRQKAHQAQFDHLWLFHPQQFDPTISAKERHRIHIAYGLLDQWKPISGKIHALELGCGHGLISLWMAQKGAQVTATDISEHALHFFPNPLPCNLRLERHALPETSLPRSSFDIVVFADVLAHLDPKDYRLAISEVTQLVSAEGIVLFSTPLDCRSEHALEMCVQLIQTELDILDWHLSYHRLSNALDKLLSTFNRNADFSSLLDANGMQTFPHLRSFAQKVARYIRLPFSRGSQRLAQIMNTWNIQKRLENTCEFWWQEAGVSHITLIGKKKSISL